jgi:hypothetical protein
MVLNANPGKSIFLYYLLLRLLSEATPVAFEVGDHILVFQANGVSIHPIHAQFDCIPKGSWALSDSNTQNKRPCNAFLRAAINQRTWIIQATSPLEERWKDWEKEYGATWFVMEPFSIGEIAALRLALIGLLKGFSLAECLLTAKYSTSSMTKSYAITKSGVRLHALA